MRLFVAVWPSAGVIDGLRGLDRPPLPGVRWTTPDQWHVTLRFLGELEDPGVLTSRIHDLSCGPDLGAPTVAEVGPRSARLGPSVLGLPVHGLDALASAVQAVTADLGPPAARPGFRGHLTLARARRAAPRSVLSRLPVIELSARWTVEEVTIVASTLGGTGSAYTVVGRAPFPRG